MANNNPTPPAITTPTTSTTTTPPSALPPVGPTPISNIENNKNSGQVSKPNKGRKVDLLRELGISLTEVSSFIICLASYLFRLNLTPAFTYIYIRFRKREEAITIRRISPLLILHS